MRLIDLYFRAFKAFRKHTENNSDSIKDRKVIKQANIKADKLTSIKHTCTIEEDWIENIEDGLIYIEKAIREERQFIRTEGEVVPIEKVKRTSKATVEHLARHSGLITHLPEKKGDPLVPDKLYMVEKLSDYAVYENRFLYMLLCYLKDFIYIRIEKIRDKMTTYQSDLTMSKEIKMNDRHINYHLVYSDLCKNDPYLINAYEQIPLVARIETVYYTVTSLLATPLMKEVSKSPMIKPPIVKTNVLRMNPNFRAALELYDYITSYNKDGYSFTEVKKVFNPFNDEMGDEIADTIELTSFISYKFGNDVKADLKEVYDKEEKILKEQENQKIDEEIKRLKKRIVEMNEDPEEYILTLEKRNRILEKESADLVLEKAKNEEFKLIVDNLENEKLRLNDTITNYQTEMAKKNDVINALNKKYFDDMTSSEVVHRQEMAKLIEQTNAKIKKIEEAHQLTISAINEKHHLEVININEKHRNEKLSLVEEHNSHIANLNNKHENEKIELREHYDSELEKLIDKYEAILATLNNKIDSLNLEIENLNMDIANLNSRFNDSVANYENAISDLKSQYDKQISDLEIELIRREDEKKYANGRVLALKQQQGLITDEDDFTTKEKFKQLESEMVAFKKLFKEQWKKTKVKIRDEAKQASIIHKKPNNKVTDQENNLNNKND